MGRVKWVSGNELGKERKDIYRSGEKTPDQDRNGLGLNLGHRGYELHALSNGPPVPNFTAISFKTYSAQVPLLQYLETAFF